jgi:lysozyme
VIKEQMNNKQWYDVPILQQADFWIAHYTAADAPVWPSTVWPKWALWQYSDGSVGGQPRLNVGVKGDTDCNMFNGDRSAVAQWFSSAKVASAPEPAPKSAVSINIDVEGADTVHVTVNGKQIT